MEQAPRALGQSFSSWACAKWAQYQVKQGQVRVSAETVRRYLHRLGYAILRPVLSISSPGPDYPAKAAYLEKLKAWARQGQIILLFEDEVDLNLLPAPDQIGGRLLDAARPTAQGAHAGAERQALRLWGGALHDRPGDPAPG